MPFDCAPNMVSLVPLPRATSSLFSYSALLLVCLLLCQMSLAWSSPSASSRPPARVSTPTFRPLHISFTILTSTRTHLVAPLEVAKVLSSRGHRITIVHMEHHSEWAGSEEERRQLGFRYIVSESDGQSIDAVYNETITIMLDKGVPGIVDASRILFEPVYAPSMRTHQRLIAEDRPDVMMCDVFAHACVDLADQLSIPFVLTFGPVGLGSTSDWVTAFDSPNLPHRLLVSEWHKQPTVAPASGTRTERAAIHHDTRVGRHSNRALMQCARSSAYRSQHQAHVGQVVRPRPHPQRLISVLYNNIYQRVHVRVLYT